MLKAIVQQMHRGGEARLCQMPSEVSIGADKNGHARQRARQHLRLVARDLDWSHYANAVAHHHDAVAVVTTCVSSRQDCRPMSFLQQQRGNRGHDRRLATAAHGKIADADHWTIEAALRMRTLRIPRAAKSRRSPVTSAQRIQWITRKGRTTPVRVRSRGGNTSVS